MYSEENIISTSDHVGETTPHLCNFVPLTKQRGAIGERRDGRQKENARDAEIP